jgi:hypothetical protein
MCQGWVSVAGLVLDIVGFLLIAYEWHHMFLLYNAEKQYGVQKAYDEAAARAEGKTYEDPNAEDYSMWRVMQHFARKHAKYRAVFFYSGSVLVILGFIGQTLGSWPGGAAWLGLKSC